MAGSDGKPVFQGKTRDERFDANDHLSAVLPEGTEYSVRVSVGARELTRKFRAVKQDEPVTFVLAPQQADKPQIST